ncbi:beta-galactosidase [Coraliomargarita algicola]|uniref:Beta-galactosidase n=1 Tax=Coraliomargarita algicola TaxID=3092156 RepID=A0ABZ0RKG3_9BACT|nr:beta-galactosidase [Coraliomargarita sp. J2-16]WPJ95578.1 beta-galactosidase [Coraliomargarita sp. J2-16]
MKNKTITDWDLSIVRGLSETGSVSYRSSSQVGQSRIGLGFETLDREMFKPEACYDLLEQSGIKWARVQTGWLRCEKEKGVYDFTWLDEVVDSLSQRGIQPWFNVSYGNPIYMPDAPHKTAVGCVPLYFGEEATQAWKNYVAALAKHYKGRVEIYEIWNESNHPSFWHPHPVSSVDYTELVRVSRAAIIPEIPDAKIVACTASPDEKFIYGCLDAGVAELVHAVSIHPYHSVPEDVHSHPASDEIRAAFAACPENIHYESTVKNLRATFAKRAPHLELWQGECGCPAENLGHADAGWMRVFNMDEPKQAKWLLRRVLTDLALEMDMISYFHATDLMEQAYRQANGNAQVGGVKLGVIKGLSYEPKLSYSALQGMCALFDSEMEQRPLVTRSGLSRMGRCESKLPMIAMRVLTFERRGYPFYIYYLPEDVQLETSVRNDFWFQMLHETEHRIEQPVLVDLLQNKVFDLSEFRKGEGVCYDWMLEGIPLADYPLIITDQKALSGMS